MRNIRCKSLPRPFMMFFFFFQAEDGIRDLTVTGVQTCALPISRAACRRSSSLRSPASRRGAAIPRPPRGPRSRRGASREQPLQQREQLLDRPDGVIAHVTDPDGRVLQRTVAGADGPPRVLEPAD